MKTRTALDDESHTNSFQAVFHSLMTEFPSQPHNMVQKLSIRFPYYHLTTDQASGISTMASTSSTSLILALSFQCVTSFQAVPHLSPSHLTNRILSIGSFHRPHQQVLFASTENDDKISSAKSSNDCSCDDSPADGPAPLQPFLPAMDPKYSVRGPIGEGNFLLSRTGPPTIDELSNEQMLKIVKLECSDLEVNTLVWKCLGYRFSEETESWDPTEVFPNWKEKYPSPPDLIGMQRVYSREVDQPSLRSNQALVRSIPVDNKQSLKEHLKPLGWKGYQVSFSVNALFLIP
ncbi:hypothetical protein ACHAXS_009757 [Conticribra weissflogii]